MKSIGRTGEIGLAEAFTNPGVIGGYHAHLYYAPETRPIAARLRAAIAENFPQARIGNWHDEPVGPHPIAMYQVTFGVEEFPRCAVADAEPRRARCARAPAHRRQRRRSHPICALARDAFAIARRDIAARAADKLIPPRPRRPHISPDRYIRPSASRTIIITSNRPSPLLG
jgi:Dopa 4,5-dioxygenase family